MKLFCREDHTKVEEARDLRQELLEARADLARLKKMPESAFVDKSYNQLRFTPFGPINFAVDNKDDAIARKEAEIAELEVLAQVTPTTEPSNKEVQNG